MTSGILVLDQRMTGMTGLDLQQVLAERGMDLPIIFISGHGNVPLSVMAMKAGAMDFIEKPFSDHVLLTHFWPLMILVAGVVGAVIGAIVGLPSLRLKHLYLVIATLSFQMIFQWIINFSKFFNQGQTISIGRVFWFTGKVARKEHYFFWYYVILVFVVVLGFAVRNLLRSKYGRCLVAVRDNDRAADAMGMHPGFTKVYAFALAGFFAGVAGALHAYLWRGVGFESFTLHHSISYLAMAIVGGLGTLVGSLVGPAAILMLELQVESLAEIVGHYVTAVGDVATALRPLTFGLVIVLFLMFEPRGIANWWRIARTYSAGGGAVARRGISHPAVV